jgi:hypothetical protein
MSRFAAFALGVLLISAGDWQLVAPAQPDLPPICAKSEITCETAAAAIRDRRWPIEPGYVLCRPAPGCFSPESEVIRGYNDGGRR